MASFCACRCCAWPSCSAEALAPLGSEIEKPLGRSLASTLAGARRLSIIVKGWRWMRILVCTRSKRDKWQRYVSRSGLAKRRGVVLQYSKYYGSKPRKTTVPVYIRYCARYSMTYPTWYSMKYQVLRVLYSELYIRMTYRPTPGLPDVCEGQNEHKIGISDLRGTSTV